MFLTTKTFGQSVSVGVSVTVANELWHQYEETKNHYDDDQLFSVDTNGNGYDLFDFIWNSKQCCRFIESGRPRENCDFVKTDCESGNQCICHSLGEW